MEVNRAMSKRFSPTVFLMATLLLTGSMNWNHSLVMAKPATGENSHFSPRNELLLLSSSVSTTTDEKRRVLSSEDQQEEQPTHSKVPFEESHHHASEWLVSLTHHLSHHATTSYRDNRRRHRRRLQRHHSPQNRQVRSLYTPNNYNPLQVVNVRNDASIDDEDDTNQDDLRQICQVVEGSFRQNQNSTSTTADQVHCDCMGNVAGYFTISCEYKEPICGQTSIVDTSTTPAAKTTTSTTSNDTDNEDSTTSTITTISSSSVRTCGRPVVAVTLVNGRVFSSTSCIQDYTRGGRLLQEMCVTVQVCHSPQYNQQDDNMAQDERGSTTTGGTSSRSSSNLIQFCDCSASYASKVCQKCSLCEQGRGLQLDCSNLAQQVINPDQCRVPTILGLQPRSNLTTSENNSANNNFQSIVEQAMGFIPFGQDGDTNNSGNHSNNICSQLEDALFDNNRVSCTCQQLQQSTTSTSVGFTVICQSSQVECRDRNGRWTEPPSVASKTTPTTAAAEIQETATPSPSTCGRMESNVNVVNGRVESVESCLQHESIPWQGYVTCTVLELCSTRSSAANDSSSSSPLSDTICACSARLSGQTCQDCSVCTTEDGLVGLSLDCTNVHEYAQLQEVCQAIQSTPAHEKTSSTTATFNDINNDGGLYEFWPRYQQAPTSEDNDKTSLPTSSPTPVSTNATDSSSAARSASPIIVVLWLSLWTIPTLRLIFL